MERVYGEELIKRLERDIETTQRAMRERMERINSMQTDYDDCFVSIRCDERGLNLCKDKINLIRDGGCAWFREYATLDGTLVDAKWCKTRYGSSLRVVMPNGEVVWTTSCTAKGLARRGLKAVECKRPAWFAFHSSGGGMFGVYTGSYVLFPSDVNYATGEDASAEPLEVRDVE